MHDVLLQTKFYIPAVPGEIIQRPLLNNQLDASSQGALTVVSAPAGFGKTTLVANWLKQQKLAQTAWLALDEHDNDPNRFGRYLWAASSAHPAAQSPDSFADTAAITHLLNQLVAQKRPLILVLDDYHFITNPEIHHTISFLIDHLPPQHHLIITTRETPPLPLHRWRARRQLQELSTADLRFSAEESGHFLKQIMGLTLSPSEVETLEQRTEGWAAGLQMAALSLQHNSSAAVEKFNGADRYITDYLLAEVLAQQPAHIRKFLLHTAILRRLTAPLCQMLSPTSNAAATLDYLATHNLFTLPLDNQRRWYRYHHLFAHLLQNQLRQEQPQLVSSLHEQAGRWFLYHDDDEYQREGLYHLLAAESWTAACELLEQQLEQWLWSRGELTAVLNWLEQIPDEVLAQHPSLLTWKAVSLSLTAQIGRSQHYLNLLKPDENNSRWQGYIAFVHSSNAMSTDQPALSVQYAQDALEFLPADAHKLRSLILQNLGLAFRLSDDAPAAERTFQQAAALAQECHNRPSLFNAYIQLGDLALQLGDLPQAEMYYQRVIEPAEQNPALSYMPQVAFAYGAYSYVLYNRNQLDEAYALVQKGIQLVSRIPNGQLQHDAPILLCGILAARQQWPEAQAVLDQAIATAQAHETDMRLERFEMYRARLHIQMGELTTAEAWLAKLPLTPNDPIHFKNRFDFFTLLRLRLAQKRLTEAEQILNRLETTLPNGRSINRWGCLLLRAQLDAANGRTAEALPLLQQVINEATPLGHVRLFLDEGEPIAALLQQLPRTSTTHHLLTAFPSAHTPTIDLTPREAQILRLLAADLNSTEIAAELIVGVSTVRSHIKNLYKKLNAHGREEALTQAQLHGLLPH